MLFDMYMDKIINTKFPCYPSLVKGANPYEL